MIRVNEWISIIIYIQSEFLAEVVLDREQAQPSELPSGIRVEPPASNELRLPILFPPLAPGLPRLPQTYLGMDSMEKKCIFFSKWIFKQQ